MGATVFIVDCVAAGNPKLAGTAPELKLKIGRHDADHGVGLFVQADGFAKHRRISMITALPEAVAEDDFMILAGNLFFWKERAAQERFDPENVKELRRYAHAGNEIGVTVAREVVTLSSGVKGSHALKGVCGALPVSKIRQRGDIEI